MRTLVDPSRPEAFLGKQFDNRSDEQMEAFQACLDSLVNSLRAQVTMAAGLTRLAPQGFDALAMDVVRRLGVEVEDFYEKLASASNLKGNWKARADNDRKDEGSSGAAQFSGFVSESDAPARKVSATSLAATSLASDRPENFRKLMRGKNFLLAADVSAGMEEISAVSICPSGAMNPSWVGRSLWDVLVFMLVLVDSMFLPVQLSYRHSSHHSNFDLIWLWLLTSFFAADMILNFFTAFVAEVGDPYERPGALVTGKCRIALRYLTTWFIFDLLATVPWVKVVECLDTEFGDMAQLTRSMKVIRVLRVIRMLRLAKLQKLWRQVEQRLGSLELLQSFAILRMVLILVLICHWNACIWWLIGQPKSWLTEILLSEKQSMHYETIPHWTTIERVTGPDLPTWTWLEKDAFDVYICCFYWTLGVMRTMPAEVPPVNQAERIYTMVFMFFAFSAFAICVTTITQAFFKVGERDRTFAEDMSAVRGHLKAIYAPKALQDTVDGCLRLLFERRQIKARESGVLQSLPETLRERVHLFAKVCYLRKLQLLQNLSDEVLLQVSTATEMKIFLPGDVICQRGDIAEAAWVVVNGSLYALNTANEEPLIVVDQECLHTAKSDYTWHSRNTVIAASCSEVLRVPTQRLHELAGLNPSLGNSMTLLFVGNQWQEQEWQDQNIAVESEMPLLGGLI